MDRRCVGRRAALVLAAMALAAFAVWPAAAQAEDGPRLGRYEVRVAPINAGSVIAILVLDTPTAYTLYDAIGAVLVGRGEYRFNPTPSASESNYNWLSGPFQRQRYTGTLYIENGGRTHRIQLEPQMYAITVDGPTWRPQQ
jgi:hypothetical protein